MRGFVVLVAVAVAVALLGMAASCAMFAPVRPTRLPDGDYEIKCEASLATCLAEIEKVCEWHGYDVVRANERRRRNEIHEVRGDIVTSEAVVRCHRGDPLFGPSEPAPFPPAVAAPAPPITSPPPPPPPPVPAPVPDAGTLISPAVPGTSDGGLKP